MDWTQCEELNNPVRVMELLEEGHHFEGEDGVTLMDQVCE